MLAPEEAQLLLAIRARPEDRELRLVYADLLQRRQEPRGELIVVQDGLERAPDDDRLRRRERELLATIAKACPDWAGSWPPPFVHGFAASLEILDVATLLPHAADVLLEHPFATLVLRDRSQRIVVSKDRRRLIHVEQHGTGSAGAGWTASSGQSIVTAWELEPPRLLATRTFDWWEQNVTTDAPQSGGAHAYEAAFTPEGDAMVIETTAGREIVRF
jgi:uncharacterized protein (TIGR02996 family)